MAIYGVRDFDSNYSVREMPNGKYYVTTKGLINPVGIFDEASLEKFKQKYNSHNDTFDYKNVEDIRDIVGTTGHFIHNKDRIAPNGVSLGIPPEVKEEQIARIKEILESGRSVSPKDPVFYNPETGELGPIKPGLRPTVDTPQDEENKENNKTSLLKTGLFGLGGLLTALFIRKPIGKVVKPVLEAAKPVLEKVMSAISPAFKFIKGLFK